MKQVNITPQVLRWARERANISFERAIKKFPNYARWEAGEQGLTFNQLNSLADFFHVPMGMLFLPSPPEEKIPLPDFRRMGGSSQGKVSPDLMDTIQECQRRQTWYEEHAITVGNDELPFVGTANIKNNPIDVAKKIRTTFDLEISKRAEVPSWTDFLRNFIRNVQDKGVLVMVNGVVGNNTRRKLNPSEFRGFAISSKIAPLIFINGADTKAAQIFTLAHEVAHLWLGESGISHLRPDTLDPNVEIEAWCNKVAAETLVPLTEINQNTAREPISDQANKISRFFRVSTLVALRRLYDAGKINKLEFQTAYEEELDRITSTEKKTSGGDFYNTMNARVDRKFATAVISSMAEGRLLVGDAMRLLNVGNTKTLRHEAQILGFSV